MAGEYLTPQVKVINTKTSKSPNKGSSATTGVLIGVTQRGPIGVPTKVSSWEEYIEKFAYGMETPFLADSYLAYSVYGFFQNANAVLNAGEVSKGADLYIMRVASTTAKASAFSATADESPLVINAKDKGKWGDKVKVVLQVNTEDSALVDCIVYIGAEKKEQFSRLTKTATSPKFYETWINDNSQFINVVAGNFTANTYKTAFALTGGADGTEDLTDDIYKGMLVNLDEIEDARPIAIPGETSEGLTTALIDYCKNRRKGDLFPVLDGAKTADVDAIKTYKTAIAGTPGALYYPWLKVSDPLSVSSNATIDCPTCGHVMGVIARIANSRGVWKAPAGTEAVVVGAVGLTRKLKIGEDTDQLSPNGINAILVKPEYGIVVWGARTMDSEDMEYVSDQLFNMYLRTTLDTQTQWAVFEPNKALTRTKLSTQVEGIMYDLFKQGAFAGEAEDGSDSYFVQCDDSINTQQVIDNHQIVCKVGYALSKPAEFVVFYLSHNLETQ